MSDMIGYRIHGLSEPLTASVTDGTAVQPYLSLFYGNPHTSSYNDAAVPHHHSLASNLLLPVCAIFYQQRSRD